MANKVGLTDAKIAGLKAPVAGQIELADGIVPGLRLRMGASGIKTYILRKRVQGKWLNVTIGRHGPSFTLAHARKKARDLLVDVEQGKSIARKPGAKRKGSKGVGTVAELYETYLSQQIEGKKRSAREFDRVFRKYIEPELGDRLADSITRIVDSETGGTLNSGAKSAALSIFEGTKQRFFAQLLLSMKLPSLLPAIDAATSEGNAVVVQLVSTAEAMLNRRLADLSDEEREALEIDLSPREYV
ncbi:MAG: DUF4102 domain-containing protein [Sphingomonadales bacterium]|nr:MAG: DUF4102 domain-containing protein [Sphingomonadales bacterium]